VGNGLNGLPFGLNTTLAGAAFSPVSPFSLGGSPLANLYASPFANPNGALSNPYGGFANPYASLGANGLYGANTGTGYGGYYESELGGYLRGAAEVLNSEGRLMVSVQQANLLKQSAYREKLDNHRRYVDEWKYWRDNLPTAEDDRQRALQLQVRRSANDPPVGEIYSGQALNTLLEDIQKKQAKESDLSAGPRIALDEDIVHHLNVTGQENKGNPGLLKNEGRLPWPVSLAGPQYQAEREALNGLTAAAYDQAVGGRVDAASLVKMTNVVRHLREQLNGNIRALTASEYAEARRFLGDFEEALALLRQPGAGAYLGAKRPRAKNIAELVQDMVSKGLRFAPAIPGDEPAYRSVHQALVVYDRAANSQLKAER
jgi:hypothetical protein